LTKERFDEDYKGEKQKVKRMLEVEGERARFVAKLNGEKPKLLFRNTWWNALESPPFDTGFSWGFSIQFPFRVPRDDRIEKFKEKIQIAFEEVFFP